MPLFISITKDTLVQSCASETKWCNYIPTTNRTTQILCGWDGNHTAYTTRLLW